MDVDLPGGGRSRGASKSAAGSRSIRRRRRVSSSTRASSSRTGRKPYGLDADPELQLIIESEMRRAGRREADEPDRHRPLRPDPRRPRQRRAEGPLPHADARGGRAVVPAVQRARRGLRPREPEHARRARRRRLRRQRTEDLDVARRRREVRHPDRAHADRRVEAPRHLVLHHPDGPRQASRSGRSAT